jgi:transposase
MEKLKRRQFTAEFKIEAVKLVLDQGYTYGRVGKQLGVLPKLIQGWAKKYRAGDLVSGTPRLRVTAEQQELSRLRQEVQRLKMEREILKNCPHGAPRSLWIETFSGYTGYTLGQWPTASWRVRPRQKTWPRGSCGPVCGGAFG